MKKTLKLVLIGILLIVFACKESAQDKENDQSLKVYETTKSELGNKSDKNFKKALAALDKQDYKLAGQELKKGVNELKNEAQKLGSDNTVNFKKEISSLTDIAKELETGTKMNSRGLREMIVNAEMNVAHSYLLEDNVVLLIEPAKVEDAKINYHLYRTTQDLEEGTDKLGGDAQKTGEELKAEGKKLEADYEAWKKGAKDHLDKVEAHFKEHQLGYLHPYDMYPM